MASETKILESIVISISAPAISLMLYDNCNSEDQAGFLLGDIFKTKSVIHERSREGDRVWLKKYKFHIQIKAAIPCPEINFYKIDFKPENIPKIENIVGWFTSRKLITTNPINPSRLTFTEKLIHKTLKNFFTELPFFTGCVLDTGNNSSRNVHSYDFNFFQLNQDNSFQVVECENPILELKYLQSTRFGPLGPRQEFIATHSNDLTETYKTIDKLVVAETTMFNLLQDINDISKDIESLQNRNKIQIQQERMTTQIQQETKKKPAWISQVEHKRIYRNPKTISQ